MIPFTDHVKVARFRWLDSPITFTICSPLFTVLGAATTIAAPIILDPVSFGQFALLISIYQYVLNFDFGLDRLSDRLLTHKGIDISAVMNELLMARFSVAAGIAVVGTIAGYFGSLTAIAVFSGLFVMISTGPIAVYRARSQIAAFTLSTLGTQFGMSIPRLAGLLADGVRGCVVALAIWYGMAAVILYAPFFRDLRPIRTRRLCSLFAESTPLFVLSSAWLLYVMASRWFSWLISSPTEAGLFAFGANLALTGIALVGAVSQTYYPKHLSNRNDRALSRELIILLVAATGGCLLADLFCRFLIGAIFPRFASADACTVVILFSGIPLAISSWLIPLVIARSTHPLGEAFFLFGTSIACLYGLMKIANAYAGIEGQAWACVPPAMLLLGLQLRIVTHKNMLDSRIAMRLWGASVVAQGLCAAIWYLTFH
jgi:O-antigen/teichoic acid export membrane protein